MRSPRGFTVVELVIALLIGSILTSIALTGFNNAQGRFAVRGARNTLVSMVARTRASAIEGGTTARLTIYPGGDSVRVLRGTTRIEGINFRTQFGVDILGSAAVTLCMSPRGFASDTCNSFTTPVTVTFQFRADTASVQILPMGQVLW